MQGVVYWQPPESATNKIERIIREPAVSRYGSDDGLLEHCEVLLEKVNSLFINWEMRTRFWIWGNLLLVGKFSERFTIKVETFWKIYYKSWNFLIQFSSRLTHPSPHKTPLKGPHVRPIAWQHLDWPKKLREGKYFCPKCLCLPAQVQRLFWHIMTRNILQGGAYIIMHVHM